MKNYLLALCLLMPFLAFSQSTNYLISQVNYNPDPFTGGDTVSLNIDDIHSNVIPLPFSFCFFDSTFDSIVISTNGYITFETGYANQFSIWSIPGPAPLMNMPDYMIMAPYQDIDPSVGGVITTKTAGVAPYRRFIISFFQASMFSCTQLLFSEQIILYETSGLIETHIADKPLCATWNSGVAIHGLQKDTSTAVIVPGRNFPTQWVATNEGWRFAPDGPCAGPLPQNVLGGKVFADYNNNCVFDGIDAPIANRPVLVNGGVYYAWSDLQGNYVVELDTGTWNVQAVPPLYYANTCAPSGGYNVAFPTSPMSSLNNDFSDSVLVYCSDLTVDVGTFNMTACQPEIGGISYCNQGTVADSNVVVTLTLNDSISLDSASLPYTSPSTNVYEFSLGILQPGQCGNILLVLGIGCDSLGTVYCISANIDGDSNSECDTVNNDSQDCHALQGSFDPNDKRIASVDQQGVWSDFEEVDSTDLLRYTIRFQNTGTDTAFYVRIEDTLSALMDHASFQAGASSHSYQVVRIGDVVIFEFPGIDLVDSLTNPLLSQGFIRFSVAQRPGNMVGTLIENEAAIYFDFNAPIITNVATAEIPIPAVGLDAAYQRLKVYPNPGREGFTVMHEAYLGNVIEVHDLSGKMVLRKALDGPKTQVDASELPPGMYLYKVSGDGEGEYVGKWVKW